MSPLPDPDFSFLNDGPPASDSAIFNPPAVDLPEQSTETAPSAELTEPVAPIPHGQLSSPNMPAIADAGPAWMENVADGPHDSSTRFVSALGNDAPAKSYFETSPQEQSESQLAEPVMRMEPVSNEVPRDEIPAEANPEETVLMEGNEEKPVGEETEYLDEPLRDAAAEEEEFSHPVKNEQFEIQQEPAPASPEQIESDEDQADSTQSETSVIETVVAGAAAVTAVAKVIAPKSSSISPVSQSNSLSNNGAAKKSGSLTYLLLVSYSSAITLFCIYLVIQAMSGKPHELESLPDLRPPMKKEEIAYRLVPEGAGMPAGHVLKVGESKRYGNLLVTVNKVEKKPIQFVHYTGDPGKSREPSEPVLKLWLEFENVSSDQRFAPIDRKMLLTRIVDPKQPEYLRSNQCLAPANSKGNLDKTWLLYDLEMDGDWNFADVQDNPLIGPGEKLKFYFPAEVIDQNELDQTLVWRVQFRKGYNPESLRGVTTVIEIKIPPGQIQS